MPFETIKAFKTSLLSAYLIIINGIYE
uniref:Uncharacterized protein n=1 Tax=Tetranychus urticae TaxID=32264 RepID=T1JR86_TETUR